MWCFGNSGRCRKSSETARVCSGVVAIGIAFLLSGCGGGGAAPKPTEAEHSAPKASNKAESSPAGETRNAVATTSTSSGAGRSNKSGIPYDAFFDDPLAVVADTAAAPAASVASKTEPMETAKPATETAKPEAGKGALAWSDYIPAETLQDEIKKARNRLTASLGSQGTYNGNYKVIAVDGAVIAALAGIAIEHSGDVSWKTNAPYIRKFGFELSEAAGGLGKESYEKSKTAFEKITAVFNGSIPADAGEAAPKQPFHEVADRGGLMKRIEQAKNWMRDNINTEAKLKGDADAILHEALIISTLGKVVTTEGYSNTDEEDYQQYADALINGAKDAATATKDQSFEKFTQAMDKVNKSCDQCHANYGNG